MKTIKKLIWTLVGVSLLQACTNWNYIDTGIHDPNEHANITMYEYLKKRSDQFYLTTALIERGGLVDLFQGKDAEHPRIMFFAPTKYAVAAGLIRHKIVQEPDGHQFEFGYDMEKAIRNMPEELCRKIILSYTFDKVYMRDEFKAGKRSDDPSQELQQGGEILTSINGNELWVYRQEVAYQGISTIPINTIVGIEQATKTDFWLTSTDIKVKNGVVHANVDGFMIRYLEEKE